MRQPRPKPPSPRRRHPNSAPDVSTVAAQPPRAARSTAGRVAVSASGSTGLLRVNAANSVRPGLIRVGFGVDFFAVDSFFETDDNHNRVGAVLSLSGAPIDYLEAWLNVRASSNRNDQTDPSLLQTQGDVAFGLKGYYPLSDLFSVGADVQLTFLSGIGSSAFDFGATEVRFRGLFTSDFTTSSLQLPLRAHLNVGYIADNSDALLDDGQQLTQAERFALGISDFSRVSVGFGLEAPLKYVTPYLRIHRRVSGLAPVLRHPRRGRRRQNARGRAVLADRPGRAARDCDRRRTPGLPADRPPGHHTGDPGHRHPETHPRPRSRDRHYTR